MPTKTEAIKQFLMAKTHKDLAESYDFSMECQVNVGMDDGEIIQGEYLGKNWRGYTDGIHTWKPFRIPYKAMSEPEYIDTELKFDLVMHAEGIGMTGWNWVDLCSQWVAFDFDAITGEETKGHKKLSPEQLEIIKEEACKIPWVTVRKSTSGRGLHLYVYLDNVTTETHTEHAALARAILGKMSACTGFDFVSKVDICGGNMWVWHRKMIGTDGLTLIKQGEKLYDIPNNWKEHIDVCKGARRRSRFSNASNESSFTELVNQYPILQLDDDHKKLINYLQENNCVWWWETDHHMLVTHTIHLKDAKNTLGLKGYFETDSRHSSPHNCFCFPLPNGAWSVRRYSQGVGEHASWSQDGKGWTRCFLNRELDFRTACIINGGIEEPKGGYYFREAEGAIKTGELLSCRIDLPGALHSREAWLRTHKDGRIMIEVQREDKDSYDIMNTWLAGKKNWSKITNTRIIESVDHDLPDFDKILRHVITELGEDYGWLVNAANQWNSEPLQHIRPALLTLGFEQKDLNSVIGSAVMNCWTLVNQPFQPEYIGDRKWNRNAAQLAFVPITELDHQEHPTWDLVLEHCGKGLDDAIRSHEWCIQNSIISGADYLRCWVSCLFKHPTEPLPYLFFYGPEDSGKSIFHEALSLLLTKGYRRADTAITNTSGFNGELEGAIICVVEETDLRENRQAHNLIKDWVTSKEISIHAKGRTPFHVQNTTHWIQCANSHTYCPIFPGDTRITMSFVDNLKPENKIDKKLLIERLKKEAPAFLGKIMSMELPASNDRLGVPVINTSDKQVVQSINQSVLASFLDEYCEYHDGYLMKLGDLYDRFYLYLDPVDVPIWTKHKVVKELPPKYPKGRYTKWASAICIGNIKWKVRGDDQDAKYLAQLDDMGTRIVSVDNWLRQVKV